MSLPKFIKEREEKGEGFDLYFAGSQNSQCDEYMMEHGANRLHSQLNERKNIEHWIRNKKPESKLFIDCTVYMGGNKSK